MRTNILRNKLRLNIKGMFQSFVKSMKTLKMVRLTYWWTCEAEVDRTNDLYKGMPVFLRNGLLFHIFVIRAQQLMGREMLVSP